MSSTGGKRMWLAVVLSVFLPGLGHVYLRRWARGLMWGGLFFLTTSLLLPTPPADLGTLEATRYVVRTAPAETLALLSGVVVVNAIDAGLIVTHSPHVSGDDATRTCPNCGKDLDEDLEFCHWCTTRLSEE